MYKVIIADDKELIRMGLFYRNNWNEIGYEVTAMFENGREVLEYLDREHADVLLADICMPFVSGLEVARVIYEKYPWMKVVLVSGFQDFEFAQDAIRYRVYDYLLKPIDYNKLRKVFEKLRLELDEQRKTELMQLYFHEKEYGEMLFLLQRLAEGSETAEKIWKDYSNLWHIFEKSSSGINGYLAKDMLTLLEREIRRRDAQLAAEFDERLFSMDLQDRDCLLLLLKWLEQKLAAKHFIELDKNDPAIIQVCSYIKDHLDDNLSLEKVAGIVHLSTRQFTRRFNQQMGESFKDYMYRIRMEKAVSLEERGVPPEKIYVQVGYKDFKYFQQLFKKYKADIQQK